MVVHRAPTGLQDPLGNDRWHDMTETAKLTNPTT